jgi:hypothetical protein
MLHNKAWHGVAQDVIIVEPYTSYIQHPPPPRFRKKNVAKKYYFF